MWGMNAGTELSCGMQGALVGIKENVGYWLRWCRRKATKRVVGRIGDSWSARDFREELKGEYTEQFEKWWQRRMNEEMKKINGSSPM